MQNKGELLSESMRTKMTVRDKKWAQQWLNQFHSTHYPGRPLTSQYHQIKELAESEIKIKKY